MPAAQAVSIFSQPSGLSFNATVSAGADWLFVGSTQSTPSTLSVAVDPSKLPVGWLKLLGSTSGVATGSSPATVSFVADGTGLAQGVYSGQIRFSDSKSGAQTTSRIVLSVSSPGSSLHVSQSGLNIAAVSGSTQPQHRSLSLDSAGNGSLNWTSQTSTLSGGAWLSISPSSGTLTAAQSRTQVTVNLNTAGLAAGRYYGAVNLSVDGSASPQTVTVALDVKSPQSPGTIQAETGGAILSGVAGSQTLATGYLTVVNTKGPADYESTVFTSSGTGWLSLNPAVGTVGNGVSTLQFAADFSGLSSGVQSGTIRLNFSDGSSTTFQVLAVLAVGPNSTTNSSSARVKAKPMALTGCQSGKASSLIPIVRQPLDQSTVQVALPVTVQVQVVDDCGNPVSVKGGGSVSVLFDSTQAGLPLTDIGSGIWEGTWTPSNAASTIALRVSAAQSGLSVNPSNAIESSLSVTVQAADASSPPQAIGIVNAAGSAQATPGVASLGSYVAIYGTGLAGNANPAATSLPLPRTLNGAQVFLGGIEMPLQYASAGQVNALIPQGLAPNAAYPLVIVRGATRSVPTAITVSATQPGIYTADTSGSGPGVVTDSLTGKLITSAAPAKASDYLTIYCTGLGAVQGPGAEPGPSDGAGAPTNIVFSTVAHVTATINGQDAPMLFAGLTPTFAGLYQVNIQVPAGAHSNGAENTLIISTTDPATGSKTQSNAVSLALQ